MVKASTAKRRADFIKQLAKKGVSLADVARLSDKDLRSALGTKAKDLSAIRRIIPKAKRAEIIEKAKKKAEKELIAEGFSPSVATGLTDVLGKPPTKKKVSPKKKLRDYLDDFDEEEMDYYGNLDDFLDAKVQGFDAMSADDREDLQDAYADFF